MGIDRLYRGERKDRREKIGACISAFSAVKSGYSSAALLLMLLSVTVTAGEQAKQQENVSVRIEKADSPAVRWRLIEEYLVSDGARHPNNDLAYVFSFLIRKMKGPREALPEDAPAAASAACGWFTGLYNRLTPFIYISQEPDNDILLSAYLAQYYFITLCRQERLEPDRLARLMPLTVTLSLVSWLDISPLEASLIYPGLVQWAVAVDAARLKPGLLLLLRLGKGPGFPGNVPDDELARFIKASKPVAETITRFLTPARAAVYRAQEEYAFPAYMQWLEPLGMVAENAYEIGLDEKGLAASKAKIEMLRSMFQREKK